MPQPPATTSAPTSSSPSEYFPRYTSNEQAASEYVGTFTAPQSVEQIQQQKMQAAQGEVDNLNKLYDSKLAEQRVVNEGRSRGTSSVNTLTGLAGSTEANVHTDKTNAVNKRENDAINNERAVAISGLFSKIRADAVTEAQNQRMEARQSAEAVLAGRKARQEEATKDLTALAQSGVTLEGLKQSDPQSFEYFARNLGGEEQLRALITLNRPQDQILDKRVENGKYVIAYQNPLTGGIRIESIDLGLPPSYNKSIDAGDRILFAPDNWDGDTSKLIGINKGLTPAQRNSGGGAGPGEQLYSGLSSATATAVRSKVTKYSSEPVVQNFATIQEGHNFAKSLDTATKNPADDQALIYALAKALDPGSVVREGEYATAQKYSQSWTTAYGKAVTQAIAGTGFLSTKARENIKNVIETKYNASKSSYDNLNKQYTTNINSLTGRSDGDQFLVDYATPSAGTSNILTAPDGTEVEIID